MQDMFQGNGKILLGMKNQAVVMAVRTAKITMGEKDHRADLPPPVDEGRFQESSDLDHGRSASKGRISCLRRDDRGDAASLLGGLERPPSS